LAVFCLELFNLASFLKRVLIDFLCFVLFVLLDSPLTAARLRH
jgi:hypothetical protein